MKYIIFIFVICIFASQSLASDHPQVWFIPMDPIVRPVSNHGGASDYMDLFKPDAAWTNATKHVDVFALFPQFVEGASDNDLKTIFAALKGKHIKLGAEMGMFTGDSCGKGIEGNDGHNSKNLAERIKKLGGNLSFIGMDEPLWFGHDFSGKNACHASIKTIAKSVTKNILEIRGIFPEVKVGDIEPISNFKEDTLTTELNDWVLAYEKEMREPLAFLRIDVLWTKPWIERAVAVSKVLKEHQIPIGMIYNGNPKEPSDESWVQHTIEHYESWESEGRERPNQVVFQTWEPRPTHVLPETSNTTISYVINKYFSR